MECLCIAEIEVVVRRCHTRVSEQIAVRTLAMESRSVLDRECSESRRRYTAHEPPAVAIIARVALS